MKHIITLFIIIFSFLSSTCFGFISRIDRKNGQYILYDEKGKKIKSFFDSIGTLEGFGSTFFIISKSGWYYLYDETGKRYKTLSTSIGYMVSVSGNTFNVRKGGVIYTYDRSGKQISKRNE
jgi:hypothetical protein